MSLSELWKQTVLLRELLVEKPLDEADIRPGMKILYAEGQPSGIISVEVEEVAEVIQGRLRNGTRGFRGVLPSGEEGIYEFCLNQELQMVSEPFVDRGFPITYDKGRAFPSDDVITVNYGKGILTFEFRNHYIEDVEIAESSHIVESDGITLLSRKDPRRIRLGVPGDCIFPNENTLEHITNDGLFWKVVQTIPGGPRGSFDTLGYRQIPDDVYGRMFGCENVVTFRPRR